MMIGFLDKLIPLIQKDGCLIANFRTKFDDLYLSGRKTGERGIDAFAPEYNSMWAFLDINDLERLMERYGMRIEKLERYDRYYENKECISYWCVMARKE